MSQLRWKWMGRVLTVTYVFLLLGIQPFVDIPAEREVQSVSADVEQTEEIRKNGADAAAKIAEELAAQIPTQDNMRASAAYRTHLAKVLIRRALLTVTEEVQ